MKDLTASLGRIFTMVELIGAGHITSLKNAIILMIISSFAKAIYWSRRMEQLEKSRLLTDFQI